MTIYECLGIDKMLMNIEIPENTIYDNITQEGMKCEAKRCFSDIEQVILRLSMNRNEHYLQIIEIVLNSPSNIESIAKIIQKTIKYRILFVFNYDEKYLLLWRNFKLTHSTEYVYTDHTTYCTNWIYREALADDILCTYEAETVEYSDDIEYSKKYRNIHATDDDGEAIYFKDVFINVAKLNICMVESDVICTRYLLDWLKTHNVGHKIDYRDLMDLASENEVYMNNHLFFYKDAISNLISVMCNSIYTQSMDYTYRNPMKYFDKIIQPSTFEDEEDIIALIKKPIYDVDENYKEEYSE